MRANVLVLITALAACGGDDKTVTEQVCLGSSMQCGDTCVNLDADNDNCGACGTACDASSVCDNGACVATACAGQQMLCGTDCKDTQVDPSNCGACGNGCALGQSCDGGLCTTLMWETLGEYPVNIMWQSFVPDGQGVAYGTSTQRLYTYTLPTAAEPLGVYDYSTLMAPPISFNTYTTLTQLGTALYAVQGTTVYEYDIAGNTWTTPLTTLATSVSSAQVAHDDNGHLYVWSGDHAVADINTADFNADIVAGPTDLMTEEPRAAWDSASNKLYLGDYADGAGTFYSFDPATMQFASLAAFPHPEGLGDAFCSDRAGHIYATSSGGSEYTSDVWVYTTANDTWTQLPNLPSPHADSASCFVADNYLYVLNGIVGSSERLPLGAPL